ncbi:hypothetical protein [Roseivivax sp. THAF30]|uniref:hypothetical protein n=1 Tax=Roseivivax sp. THAF30 TaxID=2587852 RepID=UPI0012684617|nr:hypothetical protein [Roseivivax sp. THAF30]QFT62071.1 hypothetical protein FIU91_03945 [Roseivivax sp. THAF30]
MRLADFSPEAQELLKRASFHDLQCLGAEAKGIKDRERVSELGTDPGAAIKAAFEVRKADVSVEIDDPLEFVEDSLELVRTVAGHEMGEDCTHRAMWTVLTAAVDTLREHRARDREANEHLRAAWLKLRDAEGKA